MPRSLAVPPMWVNGWRRNRRPTILAVLGAAAVLLASGCAAPAPPNAVEHDVVDAFAVAYGALPAVSSSAEFQSNIENAQHPRHPCPDGQTPSASARGGGTDADRIGRSPVVGLSAATAIGAQGASGSAQVLSNSTPLDSQQSIEAILNAVALCEIDPHRTAETVGCPDIGRPYAHHDDYGYSWGSASMPRVRTKVIYAEHVVPMLHHSIFMSCMAAAATQAHAAAAVRAPKAFPQSLLVEAWIEMCGAGERNRTEFRSIGWGGAGAGSASGTDSLLLGMLTAGGTDPAAAMDALLDAYVDNNVHCPQVRAPAYTGAS